MGSKSTLITISDEVDIRITTLESMIPQRQHKLALKLKAGLTWDYQMILKNEIDSMLKELENLRICQAYYNETIFGI